MLIIAILIGILLTAAGVIAWLWVEFRKDNKLALEQSATAVDVNAAQTASVIEAMQEQLRQIQDQLKVSEDKNSAKEEIIVSLKAKVDDEKQAHLRAENAAFKAQLEEVTRALKDCKDGEALVEAESGRARAEFEGVVEQLRIQNEELRLKPSLSESEEVKLKEKVDEFVSKIRELEMTSAIQLEKNEYLQYELTKSRAQVVGLERMCGAVPAGSAS